MFHATPLTGLCPVSACSIVTSSERRNTELSNAPADAFQAAVLKHIRLAHPSLFEQLSAVNLGLLVQSGASTFVRNASFEVASESDACMKPTYPDVRASVAGVALMRCRARSE
jgi:hypothetical protein